MKTMNETYQLLIDENDPKTFLKYSKIPFLQDKSVECYHRSGGDFLFCERDAKESYLQFSALQIESSKNFSNTKILCSGQVQVKEAIEFKRFDEKAGLMRDVMRVTAICNSEELMSWEILDNSKGKKYYRSANSSKLTSFRWPFFAYAYGQMSVVINPLADPEYVVHQDLPSDYSGRIMRLDFSPDGVLYILVHTDDNEEVVYKIKVKSDFHKRDIRSRGSLNQNVEFVQAEDLEAKNLLDESQICQLFYCIQKKGSLSNMFIVEQNIGMEHLETILQLKKTKLVMHTRVSDDDEHSTEVYPFEVKSIQSINWNTFVILEEGTNNIR